MQKSLSESSLEEKTVSALAALSSLKMIRTSTVGKKSIIRPNNALRQIQHHYSKIPVAARTPPRREVDREKRTGQDAVAVQGELEIDTRHGRVKYTGGILAGIRHGPGISVLDKGYSFTGEYFAGRMHGKGELKTSDGKHYDGEFFAGQKHGRCTTSGLKGKDCKSYTGQVFDGLAHGIGSQIYNNGVTYHGQYFAAKRHGRGTMTWPSGAREEGEWFAGELHGTTKIFDAKGVHVRTDVYSCGKRISKTPVSAPDTSTEKSAPVADRPQ
jgi:hypothetical protein